MIKAFLDVDEEQNEPAKQTAGSSIFGGLDAESTQRKLETEHLDPFAASDFRIDPAPVLSPQVADKTPEPAIPRDQFPYTPPTAAESSRMSGLAFTAGIAFVSSVVFMLVLGWLFDTFIGTAPWGIVGGIVLGSIIGFIQFFRLNSQILNSGKNAPPTSFLDLGEKKPAPVSEPDTDQSENHSATL